MTRLRNSAGCWRRSRSNVSRPFVEQLPHFFVIERTWTTVGRTSMRSAQARTSAMKTSRETAISRGSQVMSGLRFMV